MSSCPACCKGIKSSLLSMVCKCPVAFTFTFSITHRGLNWLAYCKVIKRFCLLGDVRAWFCKPVCDLFTTGLWLVCQDVWCGRTAIGEEEVDPLFRGSDCHCLLCGSLGIRPHVGWRWRDGERKREKKEMRERIWRERKKAECCKSEV